MRNLRGASPDCAKARLEAGGTKEEEGAVKILSICLLLCVCFCVISIRATSIAFAQGVGQASRVVQGRVLDSQDKPQPDAIVYLQNEKSLEVRTYITTADGSYRFGQLGNDVDYQLWAKYQNSKSKTRSISSFDSKKQFNFDLKLEPSK